MHEDDDEIEGAPAGWADPYGNRFDLHTLILEHPQRACRICRCAELTLTGCYDLTDGRRIWLYTCPSRNCGREHVYLPQRGLMALAPAADDDTSIDGTPVPLTAAGDPL